MQYALRLLHCHLRTATGVVVATGMDTQVGNIADLLDNQDELDTPIKRKLNAVGKTLTVIGLIVCVLIFLLGALYHRPLIPQFLVAISLAISIIPEGLPATATIVMALGVQRMAKKNALIRKLPAVETLGSAHGYLQRQDRHPDPEPNDGHPHRRQRGLCSRPGHPCRGGGPASPQGLSGIDLCRRPLQRRQPGPRSPGPDHRDPTEGALIYPGPRLRH